MNDGDVSPVLNDTDDISNKANEQNIDKVNSSVSQEDEISEENNVDQDEVTSMESIVGEKSTDDLVDAGDDAQDQVENELSQVQMEVFDVYVRLPDVYPNVILREIDPPHRELRFSVGSGEGVALSLALRRIETPRPMTHDLIASILKAFEITVEMVRITLNEDGNYRAEIVCSGPNGPHFIDARPSDALAISLRSDLVVPILVSISLFK